jgi:hypothetical protein
MKARAIGYLATFSMALAVLLLSAALASASKQVVAYFGTPSGDGTFGGEFTGPGDVAVNSTGAGLADPGDVYVIDIFSDRIQRFAHNDNSTPAEPYDDTYDFVSAWGADVVVEGGTGDAGDAAAANYEICTVQAECKAGVASDGNSTTSGNGTLAPVTGARGSSIAVDHDTGDVYLADTGNRRVNVYSGDGAFLRSFGWDVVETGPSDSPADEYEICVAASGDVCKAGVAGSGAGQLAEGFGLAVTTDGSPATGTVFVGDSGNTRISAFPIDGSAPSSFGSSADFEPSRLHSIAVDSRGIVYIGDFNNNCEIDRYDSAGANGPTGFLTSIPSPPLTIGNNNCTVGIKVDLDSDGAGPDEDVLYVLRTYAESGVVVHSLIQQLGPVNDPGLSVPPSAVDDTHGDLAGFSFVDGLGLDESSGRLFVSARNQVTNAPPQKHGVYVLDTAGGAPTAQVDSISEITATSAKVNATVNPNGPPPVSYRLEYSLNGTDWSVAPGTETLLGTQSTPQAVSIPFDPPGSGLQPSTEYHVRLGATKVFNPPVTSAPATFSTLPAPPQLETTGAPLRTTTTAQLTGRLNPRGTATTYHFEYGTQGSCDSNPCASTPDRNASSGQLIRLAAEEVTGLSPGITYHYRIASDNGNAGSPVFGEDLTLTTRASDAPLSHGRFPGPPGSDRAWEQVNMPDTSGNPLAFVFGLSDDGNRAFYNVAGGTSGGSSGSLFGGPIFAERPPGDHPTIGWQHRTLEPPRSELGGANWVAMVPPDDLSVVFGLNRDDASENMTFFRMPPGGPATAFLTPPPDGSEGTIAISEDGSRLVLTLQGPHDPAYPLVTGTQVYDFTSGDPRLVSFLPGGAPLSGCGGNPIARVDAPQFVIDAAAHDTHWLSPDGSHVFFGCAGNLYVRDLGAEATELIGKGGLIKSTPGAAFFYSQASLDPDDTGGSDVYRYDLDDGTRECLTCLFAGLQVEPGSTRSTVAVSEDGSRIYFKSPKVLLPGAAPNGVYRLIVATGDLAYVANIGSSDVGDAPSQTQALSADGSVLIFGSSDPGLNPLGTGGDNGGTFQYYRYDDRDRTLICVSCPTDSSPPLGPVEPIFGLGGSRVEVGPNLKPLAADGTFAFATTTPLLSTDQNTPPAGVDPARGTDVYEWRDGRHLLVTDGISDSPLDDLSAPSVLGISPSGRDVFFRAAAQLTPDALEGSYRLYDARIGGGIDFPQLPPPCPLEVCQGTPKGTPEEQAPGTSDFRGSGNPVAASCSRGKVKKRGRCVSRSCRKAKVGKHGRCVKKQRKATKRRPTGQIGRAHR